MPLYDYRCAACGRLVEVMHSINGSGPETCEACGGAMRKALSPPAIHFKGSGWAKKDAAAAGSKSKASAAAPGASDKSESSSAEAPKTTSEGPGSSSQKEGTASAAGSQSD